MHNINTHSRIERADLQTHTQEVPSMENTDQTRHSIKTTTDTHEYNHITILRTQRGHNACTNEMGDTKKPAKNMINLYIHTI